jgi:hypothetical protein
MSHVIGALGSRPARSRGFGGGRGDRGPARREPRGTCHAVDTDTGEAACGTTGSLQVFDDQPWRADGDRCPECEALVPFD